MQAELAINGNLYLTFFHTDTKEEVDATTQTEIIRNLQSGDYVIGLNSKIVMQLPSMETVYTFSIEVGDSTEYYFEEIE